MNGQGQHDNAVAVVGGLQSVIVNTALAQCLVGKSDALAFADVLGQRGDILVADGQVKIYYTVAASCGLNAISMLVITTFGVHRIGDVIPSVWQCGLANGEGDMLVIYRINLQCQGGGTVATGLVEVVTNQSVAACHIESGVKTIGIVSCSSTYSIRQSGTVAVVDGKMQGDGTVAAL